MTNCDRFTREEILAAFDEHLRRARGLCEGTRRNYARYVDEFLTAMFHGRAVVFAEIGSPQVATFIGGLPGRYRPRTVKLAATAVRVFFRFLAAQGWCEDRLVDAVPMVPHRPASLVRHLDPEALVMSCDRNSLRLRAGSQILWCEAWHVGQPGSKLVQPSRDERCGVVRGIPPCH